MPDIEPKAKAEPKRSVLDWRTAKRTDAAIFAGSAYRERWGIDPQQQVSSVTEAEYDRATTGWPDERI